MRPRGQGQGQGLDLRGQGQGLQNVSSRTSSRPRTSSRTPPLLKSIEIHNFADASSYAYAACSYLRLVDTDDNIFCAFVIAKSRLAPIKAVSIPRLELTAAVLAVRLNALVKGELKFDVCQSYFWIDSTAVLLSILNRSKRFPIFVANRLAIIEQSSDPSEWHFLPSKLNAVDLPSRGLMDKPIDCLNFWLKGPQF